MASLETEPERGDLGVCDLLRGVQGRKGVQKTEKGKEWSNGVVSGLTLEARKPVFCKLRPLLVRVFLWAEGDFQENGKL